MVGLGVMNMTLRVVERFKARTGAVKMSPFVVKFYDKHYAANKARIDRDTKAGLDVDDIAKLVKKYPTATDGELLERASKKLYIGLDTVNVSPFLAAVLASPAIKSVATMTAVS